jgi:hypothetical protein
VLQYNAGNDLAGVYLSETLNFSYNALGQLTQQSGGSWAPTIQYQYPATANDGRLQSRIDQYAGGSEQKPEEENAQKRRHGENDRRIEALTSLSQNSIPLDSAH